jgi:hypothetical protein
MTARIGRAALLATSALALAGCYGFEVPIDPAATSPLDPALLGTWRCLAPGSGADEKPLAVAFDRADRDDAYSIVLDELKSSPARLEAHGSEVAGHTVLNVLDPTATSRPWTFVRYSFLMPDVLRLELVEDAGLADVEPTSWSLREALERRDGSDGLYADFCVCVRVATEERAP